MIVNRWLVDATLVRLETQPVVDKDKTKTFAERFEQLRGGMSYEALAAGIARKTGVRISPQALHKWSKGGAADPKNIKATADFFGVNEAWLAYGTGPETAMQLEDVIDALPESKRQQSLDFIRYQLTQGANELFAEPARVTEYLKFIDRLIQSRKEKGS